MIVLTFSTSCSDFFDLLNASDCYYLCELFEIFGIGGWGLFVFLGFLGALGHSDCGTWVIGGTLALGYSVSIENC